MNNSVEVETVVSVVTIAGVKPEPPVVTIVHSGKDVRGLRRDFVQQVPVRDAGLARRVLAELHAGDRTQVAVINEWREDGCDTYLDDFKKVFSEKAPGVEQEASFANGTINVVQNDLAQKSLAQTVVPPARDPKTKMRI